MKEEFAECTVRGCRTNRMKPKLLLNLAIWRPFVILLSEVSGEYKKPDLGTFV